MRSIVVVAFACLLPAAALAGPRKQGYKKHNGDENRTTFTHHVPAPHGHAALRFKDDGSLEGAKDQRAWSVSGDTLCLAGAGQTCFDVWRKGREIQMFTGEDEGEGALTGVLQ